MNKMYFIAYTFFMLTIFSCSPKNENKTNGADNEGATVENFDVDKSNKITEETKIIVRNNSVVFFRINNSEYNDLILRAGKYSKYDFDIMFDEFENLSKATQKVTPSKKINTFYSKAVQIVFIGNNSDTFVFNRGKSDMLMGIAMFSGDSFPKIEEGLLTAAEVKEKISSFFSINDLPDIVFSTEKRSDFIDFSEDSTSQILNDTSNIKNN